MKVIGRILYAAVMVVVFFIVFYVAKGLQHEAFMKKHLNNSLEQEEDKFVILFSAIEDYNNRTPIYEYETDEFLISFFEILDVTTGNSDLTNKFSADEYVYMVIYNKVSDHYKTNKLVFETDHIPEGREDYLSLEANVHVYSYSKRVGVAVTANGSVLIPKNALFEYGITKMSYYSYIGSEYSEVLAIEEPEFKDENFILKDRVESFYNDNKHLPETEEDLTPFARDGLYKYITYSANDEVYIVIIAIVIYFVLGGVLTYFVYFHDWESVKMNKKYKKVIKSALEKETLNEEKNSISDK